MYTIVALVIATILISQNVEQALSNDHLDTELLNCGIVYRTMLERAGP